MAISFNLCPNHLMKMMTFSGSHIQVNGSFNGNSLVYELDLMKNALFSKFVCEILVAIDYL
jgi:hypothetical protein